MKRTVLVIIIILTFLLGVSRIGVIAEGGGSGSLPGSGTETDPYLISTAEQLSKTGNDAGEMVYYKIINDLDFSGISSWDSINLSNVTIDGDSHKLTGINGSIFNSSGGLFSRGQNQVTIKNLNLYVNLDFNVSSAGALFRQTFSGSEVTIDNCHVYGKIASGSNCNNIGAFIGITVGNVTIKNSSINAEISGNDSVGGFIGFSNKNNIVIENCVAQGKVTGQTNVGGFIGKINAANGLRFTGLFNYLEITGVSSVGGFVGNVSTSTVFEIENLYNVAVLNTSETAYPIGGGISQEFAQLPQIELFSFGNVEAGLETHYNGQLIQKSWAMDGMDGTFSVTFAADADLSNLQVFLDSENADFTVDGKTVTVNLANGKSKLVFAFSEEGKQNSIYYVRFEIKDDLAFTSNNEAFGRVVTENGKYLRGSVLKLQAEILDEEATLVGWFNVTTGKWIFGDGNSSLAATTYDYKVSGSCTIQAVFKKYTPIPTVYLQHEGLVSEVANGEIIRRYEDFDENFYILSFGEGAEEQNITVKANGETIGINLENYQLFVNDRNDIEITFVKENHLPSTFRFSMLVIFSLNDLVGKAGDVLDAENDENNPWKRDGQLTDAVAFRPLDRNLSSTLMLIVSEDGLLGFDYMISKQSQNRLEIYVNDELKLSLSSSTTNWDFKFLDLSGSSQYEVRFDYIIEDENESFDFYLANIFLSKEKKQKLFLNFDTEFGSFSAYVNNQPSFLEIGEQAENQISIGDKVRLIVEANEGYYFAGWVDGNGKLLGADTDYSFIFRRELSLTAIFLNNNYVAVVNGLGYLSLEEALEEAVPGDIVILLKDYTLTQSIVIPEGITFLLPCSQEDFQGYVESGFNPDGTSTSKDDLSVLMHTLVIPEGITMTISGKVIVNAVTGRPAAGHYDQDITGGYSQIILDGNIIVTSGGLLDVFGKVSGTGLIEAFSGGSVGDLYVVRNWRGGSQAAFGAYMNGVFPFNQYDLHNITADLKVNAGATYYGNVKMYASGTYYYTRFYQIDQIKGMIKLAQGAYAYKTYDNTTGETYIRINGGAEEIGGSMEIEEIWVTTRNFFFPVDGHIHFIFENGNYIFNNKIKFLTGSSLTVAADATVTVKAGAQLIFYETFVDYDNTGTTEYPLRDPAVFVLDGTLVINGAFGGNITINKHTAKVIVGTGGTLEVSSKEVHGYHNDPNFGIDPYTMTTNIGLVNENGYRAIWYHYPTDGNLEDAVLLEEAYLEPASFFNLNTNVADYKGHTFFIHTNKIEYVNVEGAENDNPDFYTINDTIILNNPVKAGYIFDGWYLDPEFNSPISVIEGESQTDYVLYAKWILEDPSVTISGYSGPVVYGTEVVLTANPVHPLNVFTYQWYKDGVLLSEATSRTIRLTDVSQSGTYKVIVTVFDGTQSKTAETSQDVIINKGTYDLENISFDDKTVIYDGNPHGIQIIGSLPQGVTVVYFVQPSSSLVNDQAINVGEYVINAVFEGDYENYELIPNRVAILTIEPRTVEIYFSGYERLVYDGREKEINVVLSNIVSGDEVEPVVFGNNAIDAGTYTLEIVGLVGRDSGNYILPSSGLGLDYVIEKARLQDLYFFDKTYDYQEGRHYSLRVEGVIPPEIKVIYSYGGESSEEPFAFEDSGTYNLMVSFIVSANFHPINPLYATLTINKVDPIVIWPSATPLYQGQTLSESLFAGGYSSTTGEFLWSNPETRPKAGTFSFTVFFIPHNQNYNTVSGSVTVDVRQLSVSFVDDSGTRSVAVDFRGNLPASEFPKVTPREGYNSRWNVSEDLNCITSEVFVSAVYELITYTITYDLDGGIASENPATYNVMTPTFVLINPTKTGHTFLGWTGTGIFEPVLEVNIPLGTTGDLSFTAHWKVNEYRLSPSSENEERGTVTVAVDGNPAFSNSGPVEYGALVTIEVAPAAGFNFIGWYRGTSLIASMPIYQFAMPAYDLEIVAKFAPQNNIRYRVEHYLEGLDGFYELKESQEFYGETDSHVEAEVLAFTGFTFFPDHADSRLEGTILGDGTLVLKAFYSRNNYKVKFLSENGEVEEIFCIVYEAPVSFETPVKAGYVFKGWFHEGHLYWEGDQFLMPAEDVVFVAKWELETPAVSISGYGGPVVYGQAVVLSAEAQHVFDSFTYQWFKNDALLPDETGASIRLTDVSQSGIYTVIVTVVVENEMSSSEASITISITKATYDLNDILFLGADVVFDGLPHNLAVAGELPEGVAVSYETIPNPGSALTLGEAVKVGSYTVVAKFSGDYDNYHPIENKYATLRIFPRTVEIEYSGFSGLVYDGSEKIVYAEIKNKVAGDDVALTMTGNKAVNAGSYSLRVTGLEGEDSQNYRLPDSGLGLDYTIQEAPITGVSFPDGSFVYDGESKELAVDNLITQYGDVLAVVYFGNGKTAAGTYQVTAQLSHPNYHTLVLEAELVIEKRHVTIEIHNQESIYGNPIAVSDGLWVVSKSSPFTLIAGDDLNIRISKAPGTGAGSYPLSGTYANPNYTVEFISGEYIIRPRPMKVVIHNQSATYDKTEPLVDQTKWTYEGTFGYQDNPGSLRVSLFKEPGVDAGTYPIHGSWDNPNYAVEFVKGEFEIRKRTLTIEFLSASLKTTYNGLPQVPETRVSNAIPGDEILVHLSFDGSPVARNAGRYTVSVVGISNPNYAYTKPQDVIFEIEKVKLTIIADAVESSWNEPEKPLTYKLFRDGVLYELPAGDSVEIVLRREGNGEKIVGKQYLIELVSAVFVDGNEGRNYEVVDYVPSNYIFIGTAVKLALGADTFVYDGSAQEVRVISDLALPDDVFAYHFFHNGEEIPASQVVNAGIYQVRVYLQPDYTNSFYLSLEGTYREFIEFEFEIEKRDISAAIQVLTTQAPYTGRSVELIEVAFNGFDEEITYVWKGEDGEDIEILEAGSYRIKIVIEDENYRGESEVFVFTVQKAKNSSRPFISADDVSATPYSLEIKSIPGAEYSLDGRTWQDGNSFSGLTDGRTYIVYVRYKENKNYLASDAALLEVSTDGFYEFLAEVDKLSDNPLENYSIIKEAERLRTSIDEEYEHLSGEVRLALQRLEDAKAEYRAFVERMAADVSAVKKAAASLALVLTALKALAVFGTILIAGRLRSLIVRR